jgi:hypothetical protein
MPYQCPQCGAKYTTDEQCADRFQACLALEYENPSAYGAVHHLTVISYMMQHDGYSLSAWLGAREMLSQFIRDGVSPAATRKKIGMEANSGRRKWSMVKGPKLSHIARLDWKRTIAEIRLQDPETYVADVRQWAASVLEDSEALSLLGEPLKPDAMHQIPKGRKRNSRRRSGE